MNLVMFDIDGTLTESNDLDEEAYLRALFEVFGFSEVSSDWTSYSHVTDACILKEICQSQLGRIPLKSEVERFQQRFLELLHEGAIAKNSGYSFIGVASGKQAEILFAQGATYVFPNYDDAESFFAALTTDRC